MAEQERAVRTRERLIGSAAETFCREGFAVASLSVISAQAGVSSGALHFHFAGKAALADAVESAEYRCAKGAVGIHYEASPVVPGCAGAAVSSGLVAAKM